MTAEATTGVNAEALSSALAAMREVVGAQWVFADEEHGLGAYADTYSPLPGHPAPPSGAVAPDGIEQIQKILAIANDHGVPLWPVSVGRNLGYGGPAPRIPGAIVLDLKRMNRILEVNEKSGYALVEPGVSYFDLYNYIQSKGYKLWIDCASAGWGSVLGNALEHGVGYTPYGDHLMMSCGMEVVLADGTVVRTGMGALPKNNSWQLFKWGFGPYVDGIFTQSNFGVVTKLGVWLMPEPPGYFPFSISFEREDDIHEITEILRPLKINMVIPNASSTADLNLEAAVRGSRRQFYDGDGPMPDGVRKKMAADLDIGMWNIYAALYGPPPVIEARWSVIKDAFARIKGARFVSLNERKNDPVAEYRAKLMRGTPTMTEFNFINWRGPGNHLFFAPVSPTTGEDAIKQYNMIKKRAHAYGFDYMGEFIVGWREMHHVYALVFNRDDEAMKKKAHDLLTVLIDDAAREGYGEYRSHLANMDQIAGTYGWNDRALWRLHERLKDALDPNGILAPGKQGIWPAGMRGAKKGEHS